MDRIWIKNYQKGVPADITVTPDNLADLLETSFTKFSKLPMYTCMGKTVTFGGMEAYSRDLAAYFQKHLKLKPGERLALMLPNVLQYPLAFFAALRAGLVIVNVNPLYTARELEHQLRDSGAVGIVILENFAHVLEAVLPQLKDLKHIMVTGLGDLLGFPKAGLVNFVVRRIKKLVPPFKLPTAQSFNEALHMGRGAAFIPVKSDGKDLALLQYTGGTTGISKGAMLSHSNMMANVSQAHAWIKAQVREGEELIITALPLYHIFSLTANCLTFMKVGGHNILIPNPRDIAGFIKTLHRYPFTAFTGVNTLFNALLAHKDFARLDFSKARLTLGGGMAVQKAVAEKWEKVTGCPLAQAYGLTETSPAVCINPLDRAHFNGSIGLPISSTWVSIRDDDDKELPLGESGELCVKGPQVMLGYWQREDETQKVFSPSGWLKTGDIATLNADGFVTIVDRKKDMILVSGFNVYPNEIEDVVAEHPGVLEVAAIGIADPHSGEAVKLFVVRRDPKLSIEILTAFCRERLTGYKVPRHIEFRSELPKSNVGKILRRSLRS